MSAVLERFEAQATKTGWASAALKDLCEFHNGLWKGKKGPFETATVIRNTNFTSDGRIDLTDVAILEVEAQQLAKRKLKLNDIIIEKSGGGPKQPVGRVVLFDLDTDEKYSFSNFTSAIRVAKPAKIDPVYLHRVMHWWYISGRTESLQSHSTGIRNLDFNAYKELVVPLPPLEEQKRIVAALDQAFAALDRARAHAGANLADAEDLYQAKLNRVFDSASRGWTEASLGDVFTIGSSKRVLQRQWKPAGVPFYRAREIVKLAKFGHVANELYISEDHFSQLQHSHGVPQPGDLMVSAVGTLGACYTVQAHDRFYFKDASVLWFRPRIAIEPRFFQYAFQSTGLLDQVKSGEGATVGTFTISRARATRLAVPSVVEQTRIVGMLDRFSSATSRAAAEMQAKFQDIADLRQSLLQKAFAGELN